MFQLLFSVKIPLFFHLSAIFMFDAIAQAVQDQHLNFYGQHITIRRLDQIHPHISGNKFFKLKYNILHAQQLGLNKLLTFGGAYSNHIAATAFAAQQFGLQSVGIIRGEELKNRPLNTTLMTAQRLGMHLHFVSREQYRQKQSTEFLAQLQAVFPAHYIIPEGGTNALAIQGCQEILKPSDTQYDTICCAVGTAGTITGLIEASLLHQQILGFSALKGDFLQHEIKKYSTKTNWKVIDDYCFGGYAKITAELMTFIDDFENEFDIPLEQIYTAKMLYGLRDLIQKQYFAANEKILVIHTGGLQGKL